MSVSNESQDARLARMEEKMDAMQRQLVERCAASGERMRQLEKSISNFGERMGKVEAVIQQINGGKAVIMAMLAVAGAIGGLLVKFFESFKPTP